MNDQPQLKKLSSAMSDASRIGIIGSPSSTTEVCLEIMGHSVSRKLVGELVLFNYTQDGMDHHALGQINEVRMSNILHESPPIRSLARQRGKVDHVSAQQDTHQGKMTVSSVFMRAASSNGAISYEPSILGTVPATGTPIYVADDKILSALLHPYREQLFYLGRVYGSKPKMPMWFKHFDHGANGLGEAYHLGIFGMTGAGKSTLAKMVMLAYTKHPEMAILVLDPKGEFSKDTANAKEGQFPICYEKDGNGIRIRGHKKPVQVVTVKNLVLDRWDLFSEILIEADFFKLLSIKAAQNQTDAGERLNENLKKAKVTLDQLHTRDAFDKAWQILGQTNVQSQIYAAKEARERFAETLRGADPDDFYNRYWQPATNLFNAKRPGAKKIDSVLSNMLETHPRPMVLVDLSDKQVDGLFWNNRIQSRIIKRLLEGLTRVAALKYQDNKGLNTLVVIDEARRLAPRESSGLDPVGESVRAQLIDAVQTTRAYGLGWMFISPTLHGLHMEIIQSLRIKFFGFGLRGGVRI